MSVKSLIDLMQPYASGWTRNTLLTQIQQAQDELFDYDSPYMRFISTDNKGFPPYLHTVAGTYRYEITSANLSATLTRLIGGVARTVRCRQVLKVFVDTSESNDYTRTWMGQPYVKGYYNPYRNENTRTEVAEIPCINSPALENTNAYIDFPEDPGTTTDIFFVDFLWEPPRLTAETIPLAVPQLYETAIRKYVIGTIQELSSGKSSEQLKEFYSYWVPKFRENMQKGASENDGSVDLVF